MRLAIRPGDNVFEYPDVGCELLAGIPDNVEVGEKPLPIQVDVEGPAPFPAASLRRFAEECFRKIQAQLANARLERCGIGEVTSAAIPEKDPVGVLLMNC